MLRAWLVSSLLLIATSARADGVFVWTNRDADIIEPEQKAIIIFDEGREDLILEVRYEGAPKEFGWIVPLPTTPELSPAPADYYERLGRLTQTSDRASSERVRRLQAYWGSSRGLGSVEVLARDTVGIYDAVTLAADNGSALTSWLGEHGFLAPPGAATILDEYARKRWVLVAMKIVVAAQDTTTARALANGTVQPVRFQFDTPHPVYPLKISSLAGEPSEILIYTVANEELVCTGTPDVKWTTAHCGPRVGDISLYKAERFPNLDPKRAYLSKLRATFEPREMTDLHFASYDPAPDLRSDDTATRGAAASYIGRTRRADASAELIAMLNRSRRPDMDAVSALWALGEIGGPHAEECLLKWARSDSAMLRVEAMESLARLGCDDAISVFVDVLERSPLRDKKSLWIEEESKAALEHLIALGDRAAIPALRRIEQRTAASHVWDGDGSAEMPAATTLALAACGSVEAGVRIRDAIISQVSKETDAASVTEEASKGGAVNGFPRGFKSGLAILWHSNEYKPRALAMTCDLLGGRPDVLDPILRGAAQDPRLSGVGRAVILSALVEPTVADLDSLDSIWSRAFGDGAIVAAVRVHIGMRLPDTYIHPNVTACCVAYAFSRLGAVDRLLELWETRPAGDDVLRAEIAYAAARTDSVRLLPIVEQYVREEWSRAATTPEFKQRLDAETDLRHSRRGVVETPRRYAVWESQAFDLEYRTSSMKRFMNTVARDDEVRRALMTDRRIHPLVRLYWISDTPCCFSGARELREVASQGLDILESENIAEPFIADAIANTRSFRERLDKSLDELEQRGSSSE